jgi:hypothetical protein
MAEALAELLPTSLPRKLTMVADVLAVSLELAFNPRKEISVPAGSEFSASGTIMSTKIKF